MDQIHRSIMSGLVLATALGFAGCVDGPGPTPVGSVTSPLLTGRSMALEVAAGTDVSLVRAAIDDRDPHFAALLEDVDAHCTTIVGTRYADVSDPVASTLAQRLRAQNLALCRGYTFLGFSDGLAPVDVVTTAEGTTLRPRRPTDELDLTSVTRTIPVFAGSDAATAALVAAVAFQEAALDGRAMMRDASSLGDALAATVPSTEGERATLGFVLASQTGEALHQMEDAGRVATRLIAGAAQERLARDPNGVRARIDSWRARHDSRLEIANLMVGVPIEAFNDEPAATADGTAADEPSAARELRFPVVGWVPQTAADQSAVELLRASRIDPRPSETVSIADRLRMALQQDHPNQFGPATTTADVLRTVDLHEDQLQLAARMLVEEAAVLGRPIVAQGSSEPIRVTGTELDFEGGNAAVLYARTVGAVTADDGDFVPGGPVVLPDSYCRRGLLQTAQCVRSAAARFIDAPHLSDDGQELTAALGAVVTPFADPGCGGGGPCDGGDSDAGAPSNDGGVGEGGGDDGGGFAHLCVSAEESVEGDAGITATVVSQARLRIFLPQGDELPEPEDLSEVIEFWLDEEGVSCALSNAPGSTTCDGYRIQPPTPTRLDYSQRVAFEYELGPEAFNETQLVGGRIPSSKLVFVTEVVPGGGERRAFLGFSLRSGYSTSSFARCTFLPIGPDAYDPLEDAIGALGEYAADPIVPCSGLPNGPLPLEDVITEAGMAGDYMEAAFLHYLDRAESAAVRAEQLGERLIAEQMEMNQTAEGSIERLNQICGTTLSAGMVSVSLPDTCITDSDCASNSCVQGRCEVSPIELVDASPEDLARLRRCLADSDDPIAASLGERPLCAWLYRGELCGCDVDGECPPCPVVARAPMDGVDPSDAMAACAGSFDETTEVNVPDEAEYVRTRPLGLVAPEGPLTTGSRSTCIALAALRRGDRPFAERQADATAVLNAPWFSLRAAQGIAQATSTRLDIQSFQTVERAGREWYSTGSIWEEVTPTGASACHPDETLTAEQLDAIGCDLPSHQYGRSIRCGWGTCDVPSRPATVARMDGALDTLTALSAIVPRQQMQVSLTGSDFHFYSSVPLPDYVSIAGDLVTVRVPPSGEGEAATPAIFGQCIRPTVSGLPDCDNPVRFVYPDPPALIEDNFETAVDMWLRHTTIRPAVRVAILDVMNDDDADGDDFTATTVYSAGVTYSMLFDALEMMCHASETDVGGCSAELDELPPINSIEDIDRLETHMQCVADRFERIAERLVLLDMPPLVADDVATASITGTFPSYSGEYGQAVADLRAQMEGIVGATQRVASTVRDFAGDLRIARSQEAVNDLEENIRSLELMSQISSHLSRCLAAASPSVGSGVSWNTGSVFVCADSILQTVVAVEMDSLRGDIASEQMLQARTQTALQFSARIDAVAEATRALSEGFAGVNGIFSRMEALRHEANRELGRALFMDRDDVEQEWVLHRAMRGRHNRTRAQYEEAHVSAVRLAWLARRAIEHRIGFNLSSMSSEMSLVEPPSTWADSVCTTTGVDFYQLWAGSEGHLPHGIQTVADYVERLKMFVDSYMLDYPFENGSDTVLMSLRDDVLRSIRNDCAVHGPNLLLASEDVAAGGAPDVWTAGCEEGDACLSVLAFSGANVFTQASPDVDPMTGEVRRGTRALGGGAAWRLGLVCPVVGGVEDCGGSGLGGDWGQEVRLEAGGDYVVSWYEDVDLEGTGEDPLLCLGEPPTTTPRLLVQLTPAEAGAPAVEELGDATFLPAAWDRWLTACRTRRVALRVRIPFSSAGSAWAYRMSLRIGDLDGTVASSSSEEVNHSLVIGALQLERVSSTEPAPSDDAFHIAPYFPTHDDGSWNVGPCTERDGRDLRERFRYTCEDSICSNGIGRWCSSESEYDPDLRTCYWEAEFDLSLLDIERGWTIPNGGFAVGNFNYRTDAVAVNLVGMDIRDCSRVPFGTEGCYGSGYVPFSLHHTSGWTIRNHSGDEFDEIAIQPGAIVSAKALAAERYLTSPLSSADRSLVGEYWRGEFRGRPLNGHYVLRIHDVPGLDFAQVQDIQIALSYRYWTRQSWPVY